MRWKRNNESIMELVKHSWRLEGVCCLLLSRIREQELSVGEPAFTLYSRVQLGWEEDPALEATEVSAVCRISETGHEAMILEPELD